jgi:hypothetical protein
MAELEAHVMWAFRFAKKKRDEVKRPAGGSGPFSCSIFDQAASFSRPCGSRTNFFATPESKAW